MRVPRSVIRASSRVRRRTLLAVDCLAWAVALGAATVTRLSIADVPIDWAGLAGLVAVAMVTTVALANHPRFHTARTRRGSIDDVVDTVIVWALTTPVVLATNYFVVGRPVPTLAVGLGFPLALAIMLGARLAWRLLQEQYRRPGDGDDVSRVLVFGAGEGGEQIIRSMLRDPGSKYVPVGALDDSPEKARRSISGVTVLGTRDDLVAVADRTDADVLLIAIPSAGSQLIAELNELALAAGLEVRVLPSTSELLGMLRLSDIREPSVNDLLGRAEVEVDMAAIAGYVADRRVLVTGAGGSIGSELCRQLHTLGPSALIMLDRDENALHGLQLTLVGHGLLDHPHLVVADVRDRARMDEVFDTYDIDVVFHTAALKHLPLLEKNSSEGVKTNVLGTANVLDAAVNHGVERFVNVSTDKAADPTSVLGATKLLAERLTARAAKETGCPYVSVRFGNVLGSRGSVLPTFREQIANGGPVTVTDRDATRFFMTIPEAVRLILQAAAIGEPGEIMILDMGAPVKIVDLAARLIEMSGQRIEIVYTGLRPGEKLHEVLVATTEVGYAREHPRITHTAGSTELEIHGEITVSEQAAAILQECTARLEGGRAGASLPTLDLTSWALQGRLHNNA